MTGAAIQTLEGHSSSVYSVAFSPDSKVEPGLIVLNDWIIEGKEKILWLPLEYRSTCEAVWNKVVVLGHSSGKISILSFKEGSRLIGD
jgi:WD40 repeat protein